MMNPVPVYYIEGDDEYEDDNDLPWDVQRLYIPLSLKEIDFYEENDFICYTYADGTFHTESGFFPNMITYTEFLPWKMWKDFLKCMFEKL